MCLVVTLHSGARIEIPHVEPTILEVIFAAHARYLEQEEKTPLPRPPRTPLNLPAGEQIISFALPFKDAQLPFEGFNGMMQHNPEQADAPNLPAEILEKIAQVSKAMGIDDPNALPKPEPHCNCMHCQVARAIRGEAAAESAPPEEVVTDEELNFRTWDVAQTGENLFRVTNPLAPEEYYDVFLGTPVGCTCGTPHCEHIHAVLKT
jgi:hypothetical protein